MNDKYSYEVEVRKDGVYYTSFAAMTRDATVEILYGLTGVSLEDALGLVNGIVASACSTTSTDEYSVVVTVTHYCEGCHRLATCQEIRYTPVRHTVYVCGMHISDLLNMDGTNAVR